MRTYWRKEWFIAVEQREEARTVAKKLYAEVQRLKGFMKQVENLTPGGSEFHNIPQNCIDFLSKAPKMVVKKQLELNELKVENSCLKAYIENDRQQRITDGRSR